VLLIFVEPAGDSESFFFETRKNFVGQYYGVENDQSPADGQNVNNILFLFVFIC